MLQTVGAGVRMSFVEMVSHKMRSLLSITGVMLGVASLVAMLTLIAGINVYLNEKMGKWAGSAWLVTRRDATQQEKITWSRTPHLRFSDGTYLEKKSPEVAAFYRIIERRGVIAVAGRNENVGLRGTDRRTMDEDFEDMHISEGSMLTDDDFNNGDPYCLLSWELAERIRMQLTMAKVHDTVLVGKQCRFGTVILTIRGIFAPDDPDFKPWYLRRTVCLPVRTVRRYITGYDPDPGSIRVLVSDPKAMALQLKKIVPVMIGRHRGVEDFQFDVADWVEEVRTMLNNAALLAGIISAVSLLVGGLSIMNVMLSGISERIHEIGVRKALGAKRIQIFVQFTVEALTLSCTGGVAGMVLGLAPLLFRDAIAKATDGAAVPTLFLSHLFGVFGIIVLVGIVFGIYPAVKASTMNPVDALRYE